ncbi:NB-ARC domain-containing protein [Streptomyces massasporeus]|uniref:NB-ARC domain-containing protein n=1 Tax=Streptomyces massasporeus TaxID=67324 RepID=UPI0036D1957E
MRSGGRWKRAAAVGVGVAGLSWLSVVVFRGGFDAADPIASVVGASVGILAWLAGLGGSGPQLAGTDDPPPPAVAEVPNWVVARSEADRAIELVCARRRSAGPVGVTTGLEGAGGFGKTTLATIVCASTRVRKHFQERIYFVTVGRSVRGSAAIAAKVAEVTKYITGDTTPFDDPELAGAHLGRLLDQRQRTLLVLDDVWEQEQLSPFLQGGAQCVRLITTRIPAILPDDADRIRVDQMPSVQAEAVLAGNIPELSHEVKAQLLALTGRWALLLRLTNRIIAAEIASGMDPNAAASSTAQRIYREGPAGVDDPNVTADLDDPKRRSTAVRATVEAATQLLPIGSYPRFLELGVFVEDEDIPINLVAQLWKATAGLAESEARNLCRALSGLSLISLEPVSGGQVRIHDVLRDYIRSEMGVQRLTEVNEALITEVARRLPQSDSVTESPPSEITAWWEQTDSYMLDHTIEHLLSAGRTALAERLASDLRWIEARLLHRGPTAPWSDLAMISTDSATARARDLAQIAHLLRPIEPSSAIRYVLYSRLEAVGRWHDQVAARRERTAGEPKLLNGWPPPDLPNPELLRTLTEIIGGVIAMASAMNGEWLAVADGSGVAIWDVASGDLRFQTDLSGVVALAPFPDGSRIAVAVGPEIRVWNSASDQLVKIDCGTRLDVRALEVAPDGKWIAAAYDDGVRIIDVESSSIESLLRCNWATCLSISPDGSWMVTGDSAGDIRVWDMSTRSVTQTLPRRRGVVRSVAIAPNGNWSAAASGDGVQLWNTGSEEFHTTLIDDLGAARSIVVSADSAWLAVASNDAVARIFDTVTGEPRTHLAGHQDFIRAVAVAPGGNWLATGGNAIRIWDRASQSEPQAEGNSPVAILRVITAPSGDALATIDANGAVDIRDQSTGEQVVRLDHSEMIESLMFSPDSSWLATVGGGGVHLWDSAGVLLETLTEGTEFRTVAISPDGTRIIAGKEGGGAYIWNRLGMQIQSITTGVRTVRTIIFAPNGAWFAVGTNKDVQIWNFDSNSASLDRSLACPSQSLSVTPDGAWLISLTDGWVKVAELDSEQLFTVFGTTSSRPSLSPTGEWLATLSGRRSLRVWNWMTGELVTTMRTEGRLFDICWSCDGSTLFAGGNQGLYSFRFAP